MERASRSALKAADFERLLATRARARSEHFVLHHLPRVASLPAGDLSTGASGVPDGHVDEPRRLGVVVPKRLARRAVTRNLFKRLARAQFAGRQADLPLGDWLLRLRQPFEREHYVSAASPALRVAVRGELQRLFTQAAAGR